MKKLFFLVLALLAPVVVYLFLQSFGANQYELPILHQDDAPSFDDCTSVSVPYSLPKEVYSPSAYKAYLIDVRLANGDAKFINNELTRLNQYFGQQLYGYTLLNNESIAEISPAQGATDIKSYARCLLLYDSNNSFITLVDKQGRIRSYFDSSKKQDFDRLITEIEILNKFE